MMGRVIVLLLFSVALQVQAQQVGAPPAEPEQGWYGKATLGYLATSGNTESSSLNSGFAIAYGVGRWTHSLEASAINASQEDVTSAEAYTLGLKSEFNMTDRDFLFARVDWRKDRFSGYEQQLTESLGYGRRLIDTGVHFLNAEIGVGGRQAELVDGTEENEFIVRGALKYQWKFSETAAFTQDLVVESGAENTYGESISALKTSLIGNLALVASYTIKRNSVVLPGIEKTDTFTALALEYAF